MPENRTFKFAFLLSALLHSVFFFGSLHMKFMPSKRSLDKLDITYYKVKEPKPIKKKLRGIKPEAIIRKLPKVKKEEILKPPSGSAAKKLKEPVKTIKRFTKVKDVKAKSFHVVVEEEKDNARKAAYISYYRSVREKIRRFADKNYPGYRNLGKGEVYVSFIVASNGELLQIKVVDEKSVNNTVLRNIAINSVRDASPFSPFPKGMGQYRITFNVIISFESR